MATQLFQVQISRICNSWPTIVPLKICSKTGKYDGTIFQKESSTHTNSRALTYLNHLDFHVKILCLMRVYLKQEYRTIEHEIITKNSF